MICRGQTASRRAALDIAIAHRAGAAVAANRTQTHGRSASAAHARIETLHGHKFVQNATSAGPDNRHTRFVTPPRHTDAHRATEEIPEHGTHQRNPASRRDTSTPRGRGRRSHRRGNNAGPGTRGRHRVQRLPRRRDLDVGLLTQPWAG
jgi:hypothetical protein